MLFPKVATWETTFFVFKSNYYQNVNTFFWVFNSKFVPVYLLLIWYYTNKNWWKDAIIVPIGMFVYQIIILLNDEIFLKDELKDSLFVLPLVFIICGAILFIRKKLSPKAIAIDLKNEIDKEIQKIQEELNGTHN